MNSLINTYLNYEVLDLHHRSKKSKKNAYELEFEWIENLCYEATTDKNDDFKRRQILRDILKFPRNIKEWWEPFSKNNLKNYLEEYLQMYKIFILNFGWFNENMYEGFVEYMIISCPLNTVLKIINHLKLADTTASKQFFRWVTKNKIKSIVLAPREYTKIYKTNSWFRYLFEIFLSKVGQPQDFVQREVQRHVKYIKDYFENSKVD